MYCYRKKVYQKLIENWTIKTKLIHFETGYGFVWLNQSVSNEKPQPDYPYSTDLSDSPNSHNPPDSPDSPNSPQDKCLLQCVLEITIQYKMNENIVYNCMIDASKTFDTVNFGVLFR